jgi:TRAP-type C4-dicarboxylate transport system permease small subunit
MLLRRSVEILTIANGAACTIGRNLAGITLILMVLIVMCQIFFRYFLNDSLSWTEEVARVMMVWTVFLVAPWGYRSGANVRIGLFVDELTPRLRSLLNFLLNILICWILAVFLMESFGFWERGLSVRADSLPIQAAWFYSIVPLSLFLLLSVGLELALRNFLAFFNPGEDFLLLKTGETERSR